MDDRGRPTLDTMRHSMAHLMAAAVQDLWPSARFGVGPAIDDGFYYDIETPEGLRESDLPRIEKRMRRLASRNLPYERLEVGIDEAISIMEELEQPYKLELLALLKEKGSTAVIKETGDEAVVAAESDERTKGTSVVTLYRLNEFIDLCRGPHVQTTKQLGVFKLTSIAGAYWRGDESNPQLQRIYGLAYFSKDELDHRLWQLEEAKKRDHRRLGKQLQLFHFAVEVGPGLPLWQPAGTVLRDELEKLAREEERRDRYLRVSTPVLAKEDLYKQSGHLPYYRDDMYAPIEIDQERYFLRPMNCPHHHHLYLSQPRSYRDLPVRFAEYGEVYRYEASGTLSGLMRTRGFCQNDAHIYCRYDQAMSEFLNVMHLHNRYYKLMGIRDYYMELAKPDLSQIEKYINRPKEWLEALKIIEEAMDRSGYPYVEAEGEAAFYGPKVDFVIESVIGKKYAISTNQLDFLATERFDLTYTGEDGEEHPVYVIHRAPLGSHERFVAFLVEHYGGAFPTWLAPVQVVIIPIADRHLEYAKKVFDDLFSADVETATGGLRVEIDDSSERMQKKIRNAQVRKIPYMLVIGDEEVKSQQVAVRLRNERELGATAIGALIDRLRWEVNQRVDLVEGGVAASV